MEDLSVYGYALSQPYRTLIAYLDLSKIPYEAHHIDPRKGDQRTESYTAINPFQEFPAIVHNGYNLWESAAIISYLSEAFNIDNQWYPKDLKIRARIDSYMHWHHMNVRAPVVACFRAKFVFPYMYKKSPVLSAEEEQIWINKMQEFYNTFDWLLSFTGYAAQTERLSIADIFAYNEIFNAQVLNTTLQQNPRIAAWYDEISQISEVERICSQGQAVIDAIMQELPSS